MNHINIDNEILKAKQELKHVGSCTTKGLTVAQIAQQDERFFGSRKIKKAERALFFTSL